MTYCKSPKVNRFSRIMILPLLAITNLSVAVAHPPPDPSWKNVPNGGGPTSVVVNIGKCTNVIKQDNVTAISLLAQYPFLVIDDVQYLGTWGTLHQDIHNVVQSLVTTFSLPTNNAAGFSDISTNNWFWYNWMPIDAALPVTCTAVIDPPYANNAGFSPAQWEDIHSVGPVTIYQPAPLNPKGMTWKKIDEDNDTGTVTVGCGETGKKCNPYKGDQVCSKALPVLCFKADSTLTMPASGNVPSKYYEWANGVVATTTAISPASKYWNDLSDANAYCVAEFGKGWEVASFHQGWGWNFQAFGNTGSNHSRFWVNISDQQTGNCWTSQN